MRFFKLLWKSDGGDQETPANRCSREVVPSAAPRQPHNVSPWGIASRIAPHVAVGVQHKRATGTDDTTVDGQLARRLPGLLLEAGLEDVRAQAFTTLERDPNGFFAERCVRWATAGAISAAERDRWLAALRQEQAIGRYLVAQIQILAWGHRPTPT